MTLSEVIKEIQNLEDYKDYRITKGFTSIDLSTPIEFNHILFRKTGRFMGYATTEKLPFEILSRVGGLDCYAYKSSYTLLGLLLFELLFSKQSFIELKIPDPKSDCKQVFVHVDRENIYHHGLEIENKETYKAFKYSYQDVQKFPFSEFPQNLRSFTKDQLPTFYLGWSNNQDAYSKEYIEKSDQLIIALTVSGLIQMAELLLDMGNIKSQQNEICLEHPIHGFGGVSQESIEARFWLPGSFGFYTDNIEDLRF